MKLPSELPPIPHGTTNEKLIVGKLVTDLLGAGYTLSVDERLPDHQVHRLRPRLQPHHHEGSAAMMNERPIYALVSFALAGGAVACVILIVMRAL